MRSRSLSIAACLSASVAIAAPAMAMQPAISRGQQNLPISMQECLSRASAAFARLGWGGGGPSGSFVSGFKGISASYITCNEAPNGGVWVNVFVASDASDSGVPGAERVALQGEMGSPGSSTPPAGGGNSLIDRLGAIQRKVSPDDYARLYADLSVLIANYGHQIGWPDGQDSSVGSDDTGRGISSWDAHYNWGAGHGDAIAGHIDSRVKTLQTALPANVFSRMSAEISARLTQSGG